MSTFLRVMAHKAGAGSSGKMIVHNVRDGRYGWGCAVKPTIPACGVHRATHLRRFQVGKVERIGVAPIHVPPNFPAIGRHSVVGQFDIPKKAPGESMLMFGPALLPAPVGEAALPGTPERIASMAAMAWSIWSRFDLRSARTVSYGSIVVDSEDISCCSRSIMLYGEPFRTASAAGTACLRTLDIRGRETPS